MKHYASLQPEDLGSMAWAKNPGDVPVDVEKLR